MERRLHRQQRQGHQPQRQLPHSIHDHGDNAINDDTDYYIACDDLTEHLAVQHNGFANGAGFDTERAVYLAAKRVVAAFERLNPQPLTVDPGHVATGERLHAADPERWGSFVKWSEFDWSDPSTDLVRRLAD